jgi:hypothetical protein
MTNIINFPQESRLEVALCKDPETGAARYVFEHVDGHGRFCIAVHHTAEAAASEASVWLSTGLDVVFDEPTRAWLQTEASAV